MKSAVWIIVISVDFYKNPKSTRLTSFDVIASIVALISSVNVKMTCDWRKLQIPIGSNMWHLLVSIVLKIVFGFNNPGFDVITALRRCICLSCTPN